MTWNLHRRHFLSQLISIPIAAYIGRSNDIGFIPNEAINWKKISNDFLTSKQTTLNLNSGSAGNMPTPVMKKYIEYTEKINSAAPYEVLKSWEEKIKQNLQRLSQHIQAKNGSVFFLRNCTEAMNAILWGIPLKRKCEVIYSSCDYNSLENSLLHLKEQKKIKLKKINHGRLKDMSDDDIIKSYENQITKKTKLIIVTNITHREGHIMPVEKICAIARKHNVEVLVDAAHSIGQISHSVKKMGCDYYISSLHKWLNAPLGTGFLYIKASKLEQLQPKLSYPENHQDQNVKLRYLGTQAYQNAMAVGDALDYLESIGIENKESRLQELKLYWTNLISADKRYEVITDPNRSCAIASVKTKKKTAIVKNTLLREYNIHVKQSGYKGDTFLRISPNIFTLEKDLDKLFEALDVIG